MLERLEDRTVPSSISSLSPASGPVAGGGGVQVYGSGFTNASALTFGGVSAAYFYVVSDTMIMASTPAHAAGVVDAVVTAPSGTSQATSADQYSYMAAGPVATTTSLYSSANPATVGQSVTLYAMVSNGGSGTPTGTVTFFDGQTQLGQGTLSGGAATISTSFTSVGSHPLTAVYGGDAGDYGSTSTALNETVQLTPTQTYVFSSANPSTFGQSLTLTAAVYNGGHGTPTGTVEFDDGGNILGTAAVSSSGQATFVTSALTVGAHPITAIYYGDSANAGSTSMAWTQTVQLATTTTTLTSSVNPSQSGQAVTFTAEVDGQAGGAPTGIVTFKQGLTTLGTGTLSPGGAGAQATFTISTLAIGTDPITAVYGADGNFTGSNSSTLNQVVANATGAYVWTGALSTDWNTPGNWLVNGSVATSDPSQTSDVIFNGLGETNINSTTDGAVTVHSLTLDAAYSGTVTFVGATTVTAGFDLEGGAINQPNGVGVCDVTVMGAFNWVGGLVNSGNILGNIWLDGSATLGGTNLATSDNIELGKAPQIGTLTLNTTGSLTFNNNAGIGLSAGSSFLWNSTANLVMPVGATGLIVNNGTFEKTINAGVKVTSDLPFVNTGLLNIDQGTLVFDRGGPSGASVVQADGALTIGSLKTPATLEVDNGLTVSGGVLFTASDVTCNITVGNVTVIGGTIDIGEAGGSEIGTLVCTGSVTMTAGTYTEVVRLNGAGAFTVWSAASFTFPPGNKTTLLITTLGAIPAVLPKGPFQILKTPAALDITGDFAVQLGLNIRATGLTYTAAPDLINKNYDLTP